MIDYTINISLRCTCSESDNIYSKEQIDDTVSYGILYISDNIPGHIVREKKTVSIVSNRKHVDGWLYP